MGALYSSVFSMRDTIAAEQEKARKKRDADSWLRKEEERLQRERVTYLVATILFLLYTWMLIGFVAKIGKA
jgi:fatty acid desaturase